MLLDLEKYMLPCFSKTLFGLDCLGCGLQRSFLFLIQGDLWSAFKMYPAIFTMVLFVAFLVYNAFKKVKNANSILTKLAYLNLMVIITNYIVKINL